MSNLTTPEEKIYYRDKLRTARYAALADAEGFAEICFAIEALGCKLLGQQGDLGKYRQILKKIAEEVPNFSYLPQKFPTLFNNFDALFQTVQMARNDAMHSGSYARHATNAAVELCVGLEEAVMQGENMLNKISDVMVKNPITVSSWQAVAQVRQLMLIHSFSFIPVYHDEKWKLISEISIVKFLHQAGSTSNRKKRLVMSISDAVATENSLTLVNAQILSSDRMISSLFNDAGNDTHTLWLVVDDGRLSGVLSPFELM